MLSFFPVFSSLGSVYRQRSSLIGAHSSHSSGETPPHTHFLLWLLSAAFSREEFRDVEMDGNAVRNLGKGFLAVRNMQVHS